MSDRPILFSAPMVRAILDGRKTMTRRVFTPPAPFDMDDDISVELAAGSIKPPYAPGDRLWVREAWSREFEDHNTGLSCVGYRADHPNEDGPWRPSIHMPRALSRLTLTVTEVKVEQVQEISEGDARAEGLSPAPGGWWSGAEGQASPTPKGAFALLWDSLNAARGFGWDANPWVVALRFTAEQRNIDR